MTESAPIAIIEAHIPTGNCDERVILFAEQLTGETSERTLGRIGIEQANGNLLTARERLVILEQSTPRVIAYLTDQTASDIGL